MTKLKILQYLEAFNLILGIACIFLSVAIILVCWSYMNGLASVGGNITMSQDGIPSLFEAWLGTVFFGLFGGLEIGRYIEKAKKSHSQMR